MNLRENFKKNINEKDKTIYFDRTFIFMFYSKHIFRTNS